MGLEVKNIVAGYTREVPILNGVDLSAKDGQVTVILGPNGAGKSTLLKTIYGYLTPQEGEILHDGKRIGNLKPNQMLGEGIAYLLQGHSIFPRMTVEENLELGGWIMRGDDKRMKAALEQVYERFSRLREKRRFLAGILSGGEQRMLEIARLTMTEPRTILLDEPSVGLMPSLVDEVYEEIRKLKDARYTILMVDQNVRKSMSIADYVYALALGANRHEGPKEEMERQLDAIVREWI
ncbi:MAG TPA: ABC transporter ATP-binding protein [Kiloniellales bacterium]|nr:ABC transporter ATP-binding protein [Kiloniellales bacterium]